MSKVMTARDQQRAEHGLPPIDCDPPRPLTDNEVHELRQRHQEMGWSTPDLAVYRPMVLKGQLIYELVVSQ
jgi:hypothetical protein